MVCRLALPCMHRLPFCLSTTRQTWVWQCLRMPAAGLDTRKRVQHATPVLMADRRSCRLTSEGNDHPGRKHWSSIVDTDQLHAGCSQPRARQRHFKGSHATRLTRSPDSDTSKILRMSAVALRPSAPGQGSIGSMLMNQVSSIW